MAAASDDLVKKFQEFCTLAGSKDPKQMTSKASGKLVADCFDKDYHKYEVKNICDASVFSSCKEKGKPFMLVNKDNVQKYIGKTALEIGKKKTKNSKLLETDSEVVALKDHLCQCVLSGGPNVKEVKQSATGGVGKLTDASGYTGAHKERFGKDGKGKGIDGREERADTSGYVGNYKGSGTYAGKK